MFVLHKKCEGKIKLDLHQKRVYSQPHTRLF